MMQKIYAERLALCWGGVIALALIIAAYGKIFFPVESLKIFDRCTGIGEVLFAVAILVFRKKWQLWIFSSTLFASWCGYALYWYFLELPCSCMGEMFTIPTLLSICLDALFFVPLLVVGLFVGREQALDRGDNCSLCHRRLYWIWHCRMGL